MSSVFDNAIKAVDSTHESVSEYYSKVLSKTGDLQTNACCINKAPPPFLCNALAKIHNSVLAKYFGCGLILPELLKDLRILDLGCGSGRDCYVLSQLAGECGSVVGESMRYGFLWSFKPDLCAPVHLNTGVDMTEEQLEIADSAVEFHRQSFKYRKANTTFLTGYIERLDDIEGLEMGSFDIIVSNCVLNLCPDKGAVLRQAFKALKSGGEMYFSDVYSSMRVPKALKDDPTLWGEGLAGALYWNDFENLARACGFADPRLVSDAVITANNKEIEAKLGSVKYFSAIYRLFKIPELEPHCEDYGQAVRYKGTMPDHYVAPSAVTDAAACGAKVLETFTLDAHHSFVAGKIYPVCGNTYRMLQQTRFAPHFDFYGSFDVHYGIFGGCGKELPFTSARAEAAGCSSGGCC